MSGSSLPPVQQILKEIEPYQQRMAIAIAVFAIITLWFITCTSPHLGYLPSYVMIDQGLMCGSSILVGEEVAARSRPRRVEGIQVDRQGQAIAQHCQVRPDHQRHHRQRIPG